MPDRLKKLSTALMVMVGISLSLMLIAIFIATAWKVMNSAGLVG